MDQYDFRDLSKRESVESDNQIDHGIRFGGFDSIAAGYYLIKRDAPMPQEKSVTESIAFQQGLYDFSMMAGERIFDNRDVVFTLELFNHQYDNYSPYDRVRLEDKLKKQIVPLGTQALYDSHNWYWYWLGKATDITVDHDEKMNTMIATITFSCYPFMIDSKPESNDIWDDFDFENDIAQELTYQIVGSKSLTLFNVGAAGVTPEVKTTAAMAIVSDSNQIKLPVGTSTSELIRLSPGVNQITVIGTGAISFDWHKEMMV